jgi:signal transduction histidine kinase
MRWCLHLISGERILGSARDQREGEHVISIFYDPALLLWLAGVLKISPNHGALSLLRMAEGISGQALAKRFDEHAHGNGESRIVLGSRGDWRQLASACCSQAMLGEPDWSTLALSAIAFEKYLRCARSGLQRMIELFEERKFIFHGKHDSVATPGFARSLKASEAEAEKSGSESSGLGIVPEAWQHAIDAVWSKPLQSPNALFRMTKKLRELEQFQEDFNRSLQEAKLAAVRDLAYGASHEVNNPLANIATRAQTLLAKETNPDKQKQLRGIWQQSLRAFDMLADLMLFGKPPRLERKLCHPLELMQSLACWASQEISERHGEIHFELLRKVGHSESPPNNLSVSLPGRVNLDPIQWNAAMTALLKNAFEAVGEGGRVEIDFGKARVRGGSYIWFSVADNGPGLSAEAFDAALNPFYSGREAGRGLGFGLSKTWRIVTDHDGLMELDPTVQVGCRIRLLFPEHID